MRCPAITLKYVDALDPKPIPLLLDEQVIVRLKNRKLALGRVLWRYYPKKHLAVVYHAGCEREITFEEGAT